MLCFRILLAVNVLEPSPATQHKRIFILLGRNIYRPLKNCRIVDSISHFSTKHFFLRYKHAPLALLAKKNTRKNNSGHFQKSLAFIW